MVILFDTLALVLGQQRFGVGKDFFRNVLFPNAFAGESEQHGQLRVESQVFWCSMLEFDGRAIVKCEFAVATIGQVLDVHGDLCGKTKSVEGV